MQDTVEQLKVRCDELSAREQMYAASWKNDTDVRQQMALEVNSMQVVLDQKNDEIRRLRQRQAELETKVTLATDDCCLVRWHLISQLL